MSKEKSMYLHVMHSVVAFEEKVLFFKLNVVFLDLRKKIV